MRVLIVCPTLNHGGAERLATLWASGFTNQGKQVVVVANIGKDAAYSLPDNVTLLPLTPSRSNKVAKYVLAIRMLRSYFKKYQPDVIIGVMYACSLMAKIAELGMHIPVINTEHNSFERPPQQPMSSTDKIAKFWLNYIYDGITVLTEADMRVLNGRFKNVFILPNPTFLSTLETVPSKENIVLAAGRLDAWEYKGFDVLIRAWGKIANSEQLIVNRGGWKLQIAGTGSEESLNYLKQLCKENGVEDSVEFLGFQKDIESLYKRASIFVLSSRYEAFGMVLVEAMSQGCACVACDYKGRQKDIIGNAANGLLCVPDDDQKLAERLSSLLEDDVLRSEIQHASLKRAKEFSLDSIMDKWNVLLNDILNHK